MAPVIEKVFDDEFIIGEGPHWDAETQSLYFIDMFGKLLIKYVPTTGKLTKAKSPGGRVSFLQPVEDSNDKFLVGNENRLLLLSWNGLSPNVSEVEVIAQVEEGIDINDGKADPSGRFWFGTLHLEGFKDEKHRFKGSLYSLRDKKLKSHVSKITASNGLVWSTKLKKMFFTDSYTNAVDSFDFDIQNGEISNRKAIFNATDHNLQGVPDGMTIDNEDKLWIALFGASKVVRVDPETSKLLQTITFPTPQITSVIFGGPNLDILYVTSAKHKFKDGEEEPPSPAGSVFKVTGLGIRGLNGVRVRL